MQHVTQIQGKTVKVQGQGHVVNVHRLPKYDYQNCRSCRLVLWGFVIKAQNHWRDVGQPFSCDAVTFYINCQLASVHTVL